MENEKETKVEAPVKEGEAAEVAAVVVPDAAEAVEAKPAEDAKPTEEEAPEKTPRELIYERIRASRPDANYDEDEMEYSRQGLNIIDELEKKGKIYDDLSKKLMDRFNNDPAEASAFLDYIDGMPLVAAVRKNMGDEALSVKEGEDGWDEFVEAGKTRKAQFDEDRKKVEELKANAIESEKALDEFAKEQNLDDEGKKALADFVTGVITDLFSGKISKEMYGKLMHARDYKNDVEGALEQGRINGRNEAIEVEKKKMAGSGLPNANAGGSASEEVKEKPKSNPTAEWLGRMAR